MFQHITIDMLDTYTFIKCLERKRLIDDMEEKVNVLFRSYTNQQVGGFISKEASKVCESITKGLAYMKINHKHKSCS